MPLPRVAIVGRPNVGKSSLLNMLARAKVSIVDPTPGVTRDRVSAIVTIEPPDHAKNRAELSNRQVEFMDTGGFGVYVAEGERYDDVGADLHRLTESIEFQINQAIQDADLVLFAVDAQAGITPQDREIARLLRERSLGAKRNGKVLQKVGKAGAKKGKAKKEPEEGEGVVDAAGTATPRDGVGKQRNAPEIRVVATKVDGPKWEAHAHEIAGLGFGEPLMCSAKNNYFRRELLDTLYTIVPHPPKETDSGPRPDLKLAIIGKRNAGKSTLVNTLAGEPRMIVSEIAGTTRDSVDVRFEYDGKTVVAIDTAGLRKKKSFASQVEWYAFDRLKLSVDRADVALLLIDATEKISQVDEQVAMLAQKAFKPVVIVVNKWDLAEGQRNTKGKKVTTDDYEKYLREELKGLWFAPISFVSGQSGLNVKETIDLAFDLHLQAATRVTTGKLNRLMREIVERRPPPNKLGARTKLLYVAQTGVCPPTIVMVVTRPELFSPNYQRFLLNRIREESPFTEVPIRLVIRERVRETEAKRGGKRPVELIESATAEELFAEDEAAEVAPPTEEELAKAMELDEGPMSVEEADAYFDDE